MNVVLVVGDEDGEGEVDGERLLIPSARNLPSLLVPIPMPIPPSSPSPSSASEAKGVRGITGDRNEPGDAGGFEFVVDATGGIVAHTYNW